MRLGTKLILAFLLLAVLPLTWITLYSYNSSITVFRKAVESESGALADGMRGRMDSLQRELTYRLERLESTGRPLGLLSGGEYIERRIQLSEGDGIFLYTDGLVENVDRVGGEFGQQRLMSSLLEARTGSIGDILKRVEEEIRKQRREIEAADDATMLVLRINAEA